MTRQDWDNLEQTIGRMTEAEKRALMDRLAQSLADDSSRHTPGQTMTSAQKQRLRDEFRKISNLPQQGPRDGFSGADHDSVSYLGNGV